MKIIPTASLKLLMNVIPLLVLSVNMLETLWKSSLMFSHQKNVNLCANTTTVIIGFLSLEVVIPIPVNFLIPG